MLAKEKLTLVDKFQIYELVEARLLYFESSFGISEEVFLDLWQVVTTVAAFTAKDYSLKPHLTSIAAVHAADHWKVLQPANDEFSFYIRGLLELARDKLATETGLNLSATKDFR